MATEDNTHNDETRQEATPPSNHHEKRRGVSWRAWLARFSALAERIGWFVLLPITTAIAGVLIYTIMQQKGWLPVPGYEPQLQGRHQVYSLNIPTDIKFAGEHVPVKDIEVYERFDRELTLNVYWQANTLLLIKRSYRWFPMIEQTLRSQGVPQDFKYVAAIESMFENRTSPAGAAGFWQLVPSAAREFGLEINDEVDERFHPQKATVAACKYVKRAKRLLGSWTNALASYNVGMGSLQRSMANQQQQNFYNLLVNNETSRYVFRLLSFKEIMEHTDDYGFVISDKHLYRPYRLRYVKVSSTIPDLARWALQQGINYKLLKLYNPWLRKNTLTITGGKHYVIALPKDKVEMAFEENLSIQKTDSLVSDSVATDRLPDDDPSLLDATPNKPVASLVPLPDAAPTRKAEPRRNIIEIQEDNAAAFQAQIDAALAAQQSEGNNSSPELRVHTIVKGDNLSKLAKRYKVKVSHLVERNNLNKKKPLKLGQKLLID